MLSSSSQDARHENPQDASAWCRPRGCGSARRLRRRLDASRRDAAKQGCEACSHGDTRRLDHLRADRESHESRQYERHLRARRQMNAGYSGDAAGLPARI